MLTNILILIGSGLITAFASAQFLKGKKLFDFEKRKEEAEKLISSSKEEADNILSETKANVQKRKESIEQYSQNKQVRITKLEELLKTKENNLQKREEDLKSIKLTLATIKEEAQSLESSNKRMDGEMMEKLKKITGSSVEELKEALVQELIGDLKKSANERLARQEEVLKENAEKKAREIIVSVIQRLCSATSVETRAVTVSVPKDQIKGKIVGKEGRNILAFEEELDVDIVFNDLPNTISLSAFNLVQRRIAQVAMEKLVKQRGEITPEVVKKTIKDAEKETDEELYQIGKKALIKMGIKHEDKEFVRTVGRLQYRTSYGQNIMKHSMEVGWVCRMLGDEIGCNQKTCLVAGLLHDVGKAIDQDPNVKDCHDFLSKEIMEKHGFSWEEVHAAWVHHDAEPQQTAEALLVKAADAISASRPGARQESMEKYLERIRDLEDTAISFQGVKRAFAVSAGREVRVLVEPDKIKDVNLQEVARQIADKIEEDIVYPGKIKVNVIRKTKYIEKTKT